MRNLNAENVNNPFKISGRPLWPPIVNAIMRRDTTLFKRVVELGADTNILITSHQITPLIYASICNQFEYIIPLLRHGANINLPDASGNLPIDYAIKHGNKASVDTLINHGAYISGAMIVPNWVAALVEARDLRRHATIILLGLRRFGHCSFYGNGMDVMRLISKQVRFGFGVGLEIRN
jgi:ankyrin repeat protein